MERFQQNQNHNLVLFVLGFLFLCFFRLVILGSFLYALRSFCVVGVVVVFVLYLLTVNTSWFSFLSILIGNFCQALDQV